MRTRIHLKKHAGSYLSCLADDHVVLTTDRDQAAAFYDMDHMNSCFDGNDTAKSSLADNGPFFLELVLLPLED